MAQPNLADANIEYLFSEEELKAAMFLDPLKVMYLQTLYARYWKVKNSTPLPESVELDRSYIQQMCELDGKLAMIQELIDGGKKAVDQMVADSLNKPDATKIDAPVQAIATAAASRVHNG